MDTVGIFEAKTHLSDLLKRVEAGARITITRHGTPIAQLVPLGEVAQGPNVGAAIVAIRTLRAEGGAPGVAAEQIKEWIEEGRE